MDELVSVIIPTYKRNVTYVSRAVESVLRQTYENIEIIVIDDSPKDYVYRNDVRQYIKSLRVGSVQYIQNKKNIGGALARNVGIDRAQGEYVTFLDDDDEYMEKKVEKQVAFMKETECDLSFSNMIMYDSSGNVVDYREYKEIESYDNDKLLVYHLRKHLTGTPTFMFITEKLKEIGGFDNAKMGQEFYLMLKAIEAGLKIRYLDECDVKVYKHEDGGISQGINKIKGEKRLYKFKKTYFPTLTQDDKRFIRFRHWAVMFVAYKRNKRYLKMFAAMLISFLVSPIYFVREVIGHFQRVSKHKKGK